MRRGGAGFALAILAMLVAGAPASAAAQSTSVATSPASAVADSVLEARTTAIAATLRCPVCQGESIQDSPAELAQQMRAVVRDRLRAGESPEQIKAYFVSKYGEWILLEPTMKGLNVMLWVLPVLMAVGGLVLVGYLVRKWTTPETGAQQP